MLPGCAVVAVGKREKVSSKIEGCPPAALEEHKTWKAAQQLLAERVRYAAYEEGLGGPDWGGLWAICCSPSKPEP